MFWEEEGGNKRGRMEGNKGREEEGYKGTRRRNRGEIKEMQSSGMNTVSGTIIRISCAAVTAES